jgi:hypothetical protein
MPAIQASSDPTQKRRELLPRGRVVRTFLIGFGLWVVMVILGIAIVAVGLAR